MISNSGNTTSNLTSNPASSTTKFFKFCIFNRLVYWKYSFKINIWLNWEINIVSIDVLKVLMLDSEGIAY